MQYLNQKKIGSTYEYLNESIIYTLDDFDFINVTDTDIAVICKLFDIDIDDEFLNKCGIMPDAINQAYDERFN